MSDTIVTDPITEDPDPVPEPTPEPTPISTPTGFSSSDSILGTILKMLGPEGDYEHFGTDVIIHINGAFERLCDLGIGPKTPFYIESNVEPWSAFVTQVPIRRIIRYIYLYVKVIFDPPTNSSVLETYKQEMDKLEWTMNSVIEVGQ